jgi:nicotinate-nucleotide adenylyltransferase
MNPIRQGQTLVFGGSFDPPHAGHVQALSDCINTARPKHVIISVSADPIGKNAQAPFAQRLIMAQLAFAPLGATVLDWEETRKIRYTTDLLKALHNEFQSRLTFCIGSDQALQLETWKNFPGILSQADWLILSRRGFNASELEARLQSWKNNGYLSSAGTQAVSIATTAQEVSSTQIRSLLERNELAQAKTLIPEAVLQFIEKEGLYGSRNTNTLCR